jgi:hypothetical protein
MILVGQEKRLAQPVGATRRERRAIKLFAAVLTLACVAAVAVYAARDDPGPRCVTVTFASFTGGVSAQQCGARAAAWCRTAYAAGSGDRLAAAVRSRCRQAGYPPPRPSARTAAAP